MVNAFGYYASAKGMVLVPNLSGLSSAAAISLLESVGLEYALGEDINTGVQAQDNTVAQQDPVFNTLVDYGTVVSFNLYNFVSAPPFFPPYFPFFPVFPGTPSVSLSATATGQTSIALSWTVANFTQASIRINRNGIVGSTVNTTNTSTTDGGLVCATSYSYDIIIYDAPNGGGNAISASASATTNACSAPVLTVSASASGPAVLVSWNQIAGAASYRATTSYNAESPQTLNGISNTSTTFETLYGTGFTYTVTAYSGANATGTILATGSTTFTHPGDNTPPFFPPYFPFFPFFPPSFPFFPFFPPTVDCGGGTEPGDACSIPDGDCFLQGVLDSNCNCVGPYIQAC